MKTLTILVLLIITPTMIKAQTPPMPPAPTTLFGTNHVQVKRQPTYTALCPHCRTKFSNLHPLTISTNGAVGTNGGTIVQRTMTFACPNRECLESFNARNEVFVPESIAVEDLPNGPSAADVPRKAMTAMTWTTDPDLRLTIKYTNCLSPIPWPATNWIPAAGGSNFTLSVICGPAVVVSFTTKTGLLYQCQATDDGAKTWKGNTPVQGTGMSIVNYEAMRTNRMYRVQEYVQ